MPPEDVEYKLLSIDDLALLDHIDPDVFDNEVQASLLEQYLSTPGNLLAVALLSGTVVGVATGIAYVHPDKPLQLFVNEVGVAERLRGRGIGKRLVSALLEHGRLIGCTEAWVATEVGNAAARALYDSLSGVEDAELAVVYTWRLNVRDDDALIAARQATRVGES